MKIAEIVIFLGISAFVSGQAPVPKEEVGFVYKAGSPDAPVKLDAYIDIVCQDSKNSWPVVLRVVDHYGPNTVQLTTHLFALPYLKNGFTAHKGALIIEERLDTNATYRWIEKLFADFDNLKKQSTMTISEDDVIEKFAIHAEQMGVPKADFKDAFKTSAIEWKARVEWKHACTRGVSATPTFMLNDVMVLENENTSFDQWKTKIDGLLDRSR